jgi:DNA repair photolyase
MDSCEIIEVQRKSPVLKGSQFGCLKGIPSINITNGCLHSCVYCYARGFSSSPSKGRVLLYKNLRALIEKELKHKKKRPLSVSLSTASDPFQPSPKVLKTTYEVMEFLFEQNIPMAFLTKGHIPDEFIKLFKKKPNLIAARIGIVSISETYRALFEPNSASIQERLSNIIRLKEIGLGVNVRIDPVIPGITDSEESVSRLFEKLRFLSTDTVSVSCLIMRPCLYTQFNELPIEIAKKIIVQYRDQPYQQVITSAKTRLLPREKRATIYERFKKIGRDYGIKVKVCGCKNPDLPWEDCIPSRQDRSEDNYHDLSKPLLPFSKASLISFSKIKSETTWGRMTPIH